MYLLKIQQILFLTMILMICRKINVAQQKIMNRVWTGWGPSETLGEKLQGKSWNNWYGKNRKGRS